MAGEQPIRRVVVKKAPAKDPTTDSDPYQELLADFCFYYPAHTYTLARKMPLKRLRYMVRHARKLEAQRMHLLTQIAVAPHTEKGKGVKELLDNFEAIMNG